MNKILTTLYLGDHTAAESMSMLQRVGITHIVNLTENIQCKYPSQIEYLQIKVPDEERTNLMQWFPQIFAFIDEGRKHGKVLVHCWAGVSRSATAVMAYLMEKEDWTAAEAFKYVKARRFIMPNDGFRL